ncbi:hypothetical protein D3C78_1821060 [compost metagenome]
MVITLMHPVGNGAVVKQGGENVLNRHHDGVNTLHVEEGFLLAGEGGIRHVLCGSGRTHGK